MTMAFDPHHVSVLAKLIFDLEEELVFDGPLSSTTKAALARRVIDLAAAGETDPEMIRAQILNRSQAKPAWVSTEPTRPGGPATSRRLATLLADRDKVPSESGQSGVA